MDWTLIVQAITAGIVAIAAIVVCVSMLWLARQNRDLRSLSRGLVEENVALTKTAADHTMAIEDLADQARTDRAVASGPLLVLLDEPPPGIRDEPWAAVRVRNLGNGPALNVVVWMSASGGLYRSGGAEVSGFSGVLHLASGDTFEPGPSQNMLHLGRMHGSLDPGAAVVGGGLQTNLIGYCADQFWNRYRFNLRTADPPEIWEHGTDAPRWAGAWDPPLASAARPQIRVDTETPATPQRDLAEGVDALHELLHTLQDATGVDDLALIGMAAPIKPLHGPGRRPVR